MRTTTATAITSTRNNIRGKVKEVDKVYFSNKEAAAYLGVNTDLNAAKNILEEGIRNISAGTVDYTDGGGVRLARKHSPMKSESHKSLACG